MNHRSTPGHKLVPLEAPIPSSGLENTGFDHFDAASLNMPVTTGSRFGEYSASATAWKEMQPDRPHDNLQVKNNGAIKRQPERLSPIPNSPRMSDSAGSGLPFAGFELPEATVIPSATNSSQKRKSNFDIQRAIPIMPLPVAIVCLVLNIVLPGAGQSYYLHVSLPPK